MKNRELHQAGLKVTLPRLKILHILENADEHHLSAEDVYRTLLKMGEDVGIATVYRVLTQFENADLVKRHNFEGGHSVFELNQGEHHDHLVCVECGTVTEFLNDVVENKLLEVAEKAGYDVTDHILTMYGICKKCKSRD